MKAYFISGLGADHRIFRNIQLPPEYETIYIHWIRPHAGESLGEYAQRLMLQIDPGEDFILIGLSLGGLIAMEMAKLLQPRKLILISSIPKDSHMPAYFRLAGRLGLHQLIPGSLVRTAAMIKLRIMAGSREDKQFLLQMVRDSDPGFIRWAMGAFLRWKNSELPASLVHIHGSRDLIFPLNRTRPDIIIEGGRHHMIFSRARQINRILDEILQPPNSGREPNKNLPGLQRV